MNARRTWGTGAVRQTATGWTVRRSATTNGKRKRWNDGHFATRSEAEAAASRPPTITATGSTPLADWLAQWRTDSRELLLATKQYSKLEQLEKHVKKLLIVVPPELRVGEIKKRHVKQIFASLLNGGCSAKYTMNIRSHLIECFDEAVDNDMIDYNPVRIVKVPTHETAPKKTTVLDLELWLNLIDYLSERAVSNHYARAGLVAAMLGTRLGESLGLRWPDIDFEAGTVNVEWQVLRTREPVRALILDDLKTISSHRVVGLPTGLHDVLLEVKRTHPELGFEGWVTPGLKGGLPRPEGFSKWMKETAFPAVGAPPEVTVHTLRHTVSSLLLHDGAEDIAVAGQLGHSDAATTRRLYSRRQQVARVEILARINDLAGQRSRRLPHASASEA